MEDIGNYGYTLFRTQPDGAVVGSVYPCDGRVLNSPLRLLGMRTTQQKAGHAA